MNKLLVWCVVLVLGLVAGAAQAEDDEHGRSLFELCTQCHGSAGEGRQQYLAPAIAGMPEWYLKRQLENFASGARGTHFDDIVGMRMRPMALSLNHDGDIAAVAAYVAALPAVPQPVTVQGGDAEAGKTRYMLCASCHGVNGEGAEPQGGPPLAGQSDWYLKSSIERYQQRVRGTDPRDTWGLMMAPMAATLTDEQAVKDVVAHIMTLSN